jgi:ferric-dicitrate binding protein FerR (iron transport regulator)
MENKDIDLLLEKYRRGTATEAEKAFLESWYLTREPDAPPPLGPRELAEDLLLIADGLPLQRTRRRPVQPAGRQIIRWPRLATVAAAAALLFAIYYWWPHSPKRSQIAILRVGNTHQMLALTDGSRVWVHTGSVFRYPRAFDGKKREVELSGEAYFDVREDAVRPFIIHTGQVLTTVLGTAFDIKEDTPHHTVEVTVTHGKVSVADGGTLLGVVTPDRQLRFNTVSRQSEQRTVDAMQVTAWQRIGMRFDDITFADAARQLEARFGIRITFANDHVKNCRFTGASLNGDQLETILKTICDFNQATYRKQADGSFLVDGPGCDSISN